MAEIALIMRRLGFETGHYEGPRGSEYDRRGRMWGDCTSGIAPGALGNRRFCGRGLHDGRRQCLSQAW
jgi:hypothetical protein